MQSFNIEDSRLGSIMSGGKKNAPQGDEKKSNILCLIAGLSFLSLGYHLSVFNAISFYIWDICKSDWYPLSFINAVDLAFEIPVVIAGLIVCLQKIKLPQYNYFFISSDVLMFFGSLWSFGLLGLDLGWIFFGRILSGIAGGVTITATMVYLREVQFHLCKSEFKTEIRRFSTEICFALGIFLGLTPAKTLSSLADYQDYGMNYDKLTGDREGDFSTQILLAAVPIIASIARIVLLRKYGEIELPPYSPAFSDEGIQQLSLELDAQDNPVGCVKFEDAQTMMKLLEEPYRKRLDTAYVLYFLQIAMGFVIGVVNPFFISEFYSIITPEDRPPKDVQLESIYMGAEYLLANVVIGFLLLFMKVARKKILIGSTLLASLFSIVLIAMTFMFNMEDSETVLDLYLLSSYVGLGVCLEIYIEEILPGKGVQGLQVVRWFMIVVMGIITRFFLQIILFYTILFMFMFLISITGLFVVYILIPESVNVEASHVDVLFEDIEGIEEEDRAPKFSSLSTNEQTTDGLSTQLD